MRIVLIFFAILCATLKAAGDEPKAIRVKLDWLNAAELRIEGCKPQSVVLPAGTAVRFQLQKRPGEPEFQVTADWVEANIRITLDKMMQTESGTPVDTRVSEVMTPGETHEFHVANFKFGVTATEYIAKPNPGKAKPAAAEKPPRP